jgi:hypothetical protein
MAGNRLFISYKHEGTWVDMAAKFKIKLKNYGPAWNLETFIDSDDITVGDVWRDSVDAAVEGCTHFLCLLCDDYWESLECRRELDAVLQRRVEGSPVRMLFVLAEPMKPQYLRFNADGSRVGDVAKVGDFHFLGPFDDAQKLVPLHELPPAQWGKAIEKMLTRLQGTLA